VRTPTPEELKYFENEMVRPSFIRKKEEARESPPVAGSRKPGVMKRMMGAYAVKDDPTENYDIPTFMRRKAD
jgi:hypothetical protein